MSLISDLPILWRMLRGMSRGGDHASKLEGFYAGQASAYDRFRERLLHGRDELLARLPLLPGATVVELGAGTGRNLEPVAGRIPGLSAVHLVDLCPSLLAVARSRIAAHGWSNVHAVEADATTWRPPEPADVVICAYSLTMMPDWRAVVANATAMLKPGGVLAVVDFTVIDQITADLAKTSAQPAIIRWFWRRWFAHDGVRPDPRLLPHLAANLTPLHIKANRGSMPYMPVKMGYALFVGQV